MILGILIGLMAGVAVGVFSIGLVAVTAVRKAREEAARLRRILTVTTEVH